LLKLRDHAVNEIAKAEAEIAQCLANFVCCVLEDVKTSYKLSPEEKIELFKRLILAAAVKEKAIAEVIEALADLVKAEKHFMDAADEVM